MKHTTAIAAIFLLAAPLANAQEGRYGLSADIVHDDNATRGLYEADRKADNIVAIEGSATRSVLLSAKSGALFRAIARYSHFTDIKDISNLALIGRAAWRYQPTPGYSAPWFELAGQAELLRHSDSELRDGNIIGGEASVGSHVTDRTRLSAGLGLDKRSGGGPAGLYDLSTNRLWATIDYRVGVRNTIYGRFTRLAGDQVFNSITVSGLSPVWEPDPVFVGVLGRATDSYRLDATTLSLEVGFNYPLGRGQALDFSAARHDSKAGEGPVEGVKYSITQLRASYLYRFQ